MYVSAQGALSLIRDLGGKGLLLVISDSLAPADGTALMREIGRSLSNA